jgi:hypothetical protein
MVLKTRSLPMLLRQKNREFNGKVLLAEQVTDSTYLANALGGLYAKLESSEKYIN